MSDISVLVDDLFEVYPELAPRGSGMISYIAPHHHKERFAEALVVAAKQSRDAKLVARLNKINKKED